MFAWEYLQQAEAWGVQIGERERFLFQRYLELLYEYNRHTNLTRVPESEAVGRHLLDSLAVLAAYQPLPTARLLDVGTGAGLPGIPLKIVRDNLRLTLLDSHGKSIGFLHQVGEVLGLRGVEYVQARAEEWAHTPEARERFDIVVARAVARLPILTELLLPFVCVGGVGIALKSEKEEVEIETAVEPAERLGATLKVHSVSFDTEAGGVTRLVVLLLKHSPTPAQYPRRWARIQREPLGGKP